MMWATLFAVALMLVVCALMPTVNEVSDHFPADLLWRFRISSFGTHLVLWSVIGVAFGALAERTPTTREHRPAFRRFCHAGCRPAGSDALNVRDGRREAAGIRSDPD